MGRRTVHDLARRRRPFLYLVGQAPIRSRAIRWNIDGQTTHDIQLIALGKTGYGKSTTLNVLLGEKIFETSDIESCTSEMQSMEYDFGCDDLCSFSVADMPGVGESLQKDKEYLSLYRAAIGMSHVVLYFLRADQRDLTIDLDIFEKIIGGREPLSRTIIVLNCVDKVEPMSDDRSCISDEQLVNIDRKVDILVRDLGVARSDVIPMSALTTFGLDKLEKAIERKTKRLLQEQN